MMSELIESNRVSTRRGLALVSLLSSLLAVSARAAEVPPESEEALIDRGIALREARNDTAALELFRKAYDLKKGARALAQAALAEQALGRWVEAESDLGLALGRTDDAWIARNKPLLNQALTEIQDHLGTLQVSGGVPGAEIFLNGAAEGRLPLARALRVNAGSVTVQVRAAGYQPYERAVTIPKRSVVQETVTLVPALAPGIATSSDGEARGPGWSTRKKVGLGVAAAAVVSAAVGTTFLFVRDSRAQTFNDAGCGTEALTPDCSGLRDREESAKAVSMVGLLGAVVLGGVGAYLLVWPTASDPGRVAEVDRGGLLRCAPASSPSAAGVSITCGGRF